MEKLYLNYFALLQSWLHHIVVDNSAIPARLSCETVDETERIANLGNPLEQMEKFDLMNELNVQRTCSLCT